MLSAVLDAFVDDQMNVQILRNVCFDVSQKPQELPREALHR
jgi:hypothetical protein